MSSGGGESVEYTEEGDPIPRTWAQRWTDVWSEEALPRNLFVSLRRLLLGFGLAAVVGIPLGVLCGCYSRIHAFFLPLSIFGRNIPLAALVGLTFALFGIAEFQKVMFIFLACVAFVLSDTAQAVRAVGSQYVDTAFTLGARSWQVIFKVLIPLALPSVFNSLRLLFGLAFGYIMLAETIKFGNEAGGLGSIINVAMKRNNREKVLLVLLIIPVVALAIDRALYWVQRELFPHEFGGRGLLNRCVRATLHAAEDLKHLLFHRAAASPVPGIPSTKP
ncbi:MAG: ABC transporter permease subunit [Planctomycetota bacterium]|nr:ABC transporter permease subunit [Planctomycetota bacterium]